MTVNMTVIWRRPLLTESKKMTKIFCFARFLSCFCMFFCEQVSLFFCIFLLVLFLILSSIISWWSFLFLISISTVSFIFWFSVLSQLPLLLNCTVFFFLFPYFRWYNIKKPQLSDIILKDCMIQCVFSVMVMETKLSHQQKLTRPHYQMAPTAICLLLFSRTFF